MNHMEATISHEVKLRMWMDVMWNEIPDGLGAGMYRM